MGEGQGEGDGDESMIIHVECYSGYKANERPVSFTIDGKKLMVEEIIDRWYGEDYTYFKLRADDRNVYILKHQAGRDEWEMVLFETPRPPFLQKG